MRSVSVTAEVADTDLQIRGGGGRGGHPDFEIREARSQNFCFFRPFGTRFGLKMRGDPAPPGPSPGSATALGYGRGRLY